MDVPDVTQILNAIEAGDAQAAEQLLPLVHDELRRLAAARSLQQQLLSGGHKAGSRSKVENPWFRQR